MVELQESSFWKNYLLGQDEPSKPLAAFAAHAEICGTYFSSIPESKGTFRYAPEKWSVKQVVGHITDTNLIFLYRLISIARGEVKSLPGFDENTFVANASFDSQSWREIIGAYRSVSESALALITGLDAQAWARTGTANDVRITPKDMLWVLMGHERHHIRTLKDRYGIG